MGFRRKQRKITHFFKGTGVSLERLTPVFRRRGSFGTIALFEHPELGRVFVLNGEIQHVEAWAPLYHEPLVHLAAAFVKVVKDVLILGGGTLYAAQEALKYQSVRRVQLIDHEPAVIESTAAHYEHARACLNDKRFCMTCADAYSSIHWPENEFDLIINDGADLLGLKSRSDRTVFDRMMFRLKAHGVCSDVVYRHVFEKRWVDQTINQLGRRRFALSLVFLPEYHGILHLLCLWGKETSNVSQRIAQPLNREQLDWRRGAACCPCLYYDPRFLPYYLHLPPYLRTVLPAKRIGA